VRQVSHMSHWLFFVPQSGESVASSIRMMICRMRSDSVTQVLRRPNSPEISETRHFRTASSDWLSLRKSSPECIPVSVYLIQKPNFYFIFLASGEHPEETGISALLPNPCENPPVLLKRNECLLPAGQDHAAAQPTWWGELELLKIACGT